MTRRRKILAATASLILLLTALLFRGLDWGKWSFQLPVIDGTVARRETAVPIETARAQMTPRITDRRLSETEDRRPTSNATTPVIATSTTKQRSPKDPEAGPPYWCFRTYFPRMPWMMNTDERNTGNAARSDSDIVWNGERSLRMDIEPIGNGPDPVIQGLSAQRNVLWQAIRADPFRGKRVSFRPTLRVTRGG